MNNIAIRVCRVPGSPATPLPAYATPGSSGMDLSSAADMTVRPGETVLVPTGLRLEIPEGFEAQVRPRSGLAVRHGIGVLNSPGTIDSDYRGELKIILSNFGKQDFTIRRNDRVAQLVVAPVVRAVLVEVAEINETSRSEGGFGHTGT